MTTYAFGDAAATSITTIAGVTAAGGTTGAATDLQTNGSGLLLNENNFSVVGVFKTGSSRSRITLPNGYSPGAGEYAAALIHCDGSNNGYRARLDNQTGTTFGRIQVSKDGSFHDVPTFTTSINTADTGEVEIDLYLTGTTIHIDVYQNGALFEALTSADGTPLSRGGTGLEIAREGSASSVIPITAWDDNVAGGGGSILPLLNAYYG